MNTARIVVLGIAICAGGVAAYLASGSDKVAPPAPVAVQQLPTVDVLVAKDDIGLGQTVAAESLQWQTWTESSSSGSFIRKKDRPEAVTELAGSIARGPFIAGEPIREQKLVKANGSGFMAAILPSGMRAVSTEISAETGAGGFILPNDRVDVILTRRDPETTKQTGVDAWTSEIILRNVRVLAIDQSFEEQDGQKVIAGSTATLELTAPQTEVLALGKEMGSISLTLRPLADANPNGLAGGAQPETGQGIMGAGTVVRYGITNAAPR